QDQAISTSLLRDDGSWKIQWLVDGRPDYADLVARLSLQEAAMGAKMPGSWLAQSVFIESLPEINWLEHSYRQFPPFAVGPFYIHGSHSSALQSEGMIPLQIDAATAFGSGEHGTTSGCMLLMEGLKQTGFQPRRCLDMGCGSGILAIAAHKLWGCPVLAVDIDPESVRVTENHCRINETGNAVAAIAGDGFAAPAVDENGPYDLIVANILPQPLKDMAPALARALAPAGRVILSGILTHQADGVAEIYARHGIAVIRRLDRGEWTALLSGRNA
ncbi:MAG TPA: 50S ribosomal protein L11 methyltransferase, partial [Micavibrio sp.]